MLPSHVSTYWRQKDYVNFLIYSFFGMGYIISNLKRQESGFTLCLYKQNVIALNTHEMERH